MRKTWSMASSRTLEKVGSSADSSSSTDGLLGLGDEGAAPGRGQVGEARGDGLAVGEFGLLGRGPLGDGQALRHSSVAEQEQRPVELGEDRRQLGALGRSLAAGCAAGCRAPGRPGSGGDELDETVGHLQQRLVVGVGVRTGQDRGAPGEKLPQQERRLLGGELGVEQVEDQFGEQREGLGAVLGALEVAPVAQQDDLEAVDQQVDVAVGVEVLGQGVGERPLDSEVLVHGLEEGQVRSGMTTGWAVRSMLALRASESTGISIGSISPPGRRAAPPGPASPPSRRRSAGSWSRRVRSTRQMRMPSTSVTLARKLPSRTSSPTRGRRCSCSNTRPPRVGKPSSGTCRPKDSSRSSTRAAPSTE